MHDRSRCTLPRLAAPIAALPTTQNPQRLTPSASAPIAKSVTPTVEHTISPVRQLGVLKLAKLTPRLVRIAYTSKEAQARLDDLQP